MTGEVTKSNSAAATTTKNNKEYWFKWKWKTETGASRPRNLGAGSLWVPGGSIKNLKIFTFLLWPQFSVQPVIPPQLHQSHSPVRVCASLLVCVGVSTCACQGWLCAEPIMSLCGSHLPVLTFTAQLPADHLPLPLPLPRLDVCVVLRLCCPEKRRQHRLPRHFRSLRWCVPDVQFLRDTQLQQLESDWAGGAFPSSKSFLYLLVRGKTWTVIGWSLSQFRFIQPKV